jgi:hypothetical protein
MEGIILIRLLSYRLLVALVLIIVAGSMSIVSAQPVLELSKVSQIFRNIAVITDTTTIKIIFDDYLIPEFIDETEKIEIIDIGGIGFGSNDILIIYPSLRVYMLEDPSPDMANVMRDWSISELRRDASNELGGNYFYPAFADTMKVIPTLEMQRELVQNALIADILESLERNYKAKPISLRFERDNEGFTFQIWNHEPDSFAFSPRPKNSPGNIGTNDLVYLLYRESKVVAEDTLTDVIFFNRSVRDSVYMPPIVQREFMRVTTECEVCVNIFEDVGRSWIALTLGAHGSFWNNAALKSDYDPGAGLQVGFVIKPANYFFKMGIGVSVHTFRSLVLKDDTDLENRPEGEDLERVTSNLLNAHVTGMIGFNWRSSKAIGGNFGIGSRLNRIYSTSVPTFTPQDPAVSLYIEGAIAVGVADLFIRQSVTSSNAMLGYREYGVNISLKRNR